MFNNVFSLLLVEGLNPYLGNLHGAERPKPYLAFDLMEEWRSPIIRFYWLSPDAVSRVLVIGSPAPEPPPNAYII